MDGFEIASDSHSIAFTWVSASFSDLGNDLFGVKIHSDFFKVTQRSHLTFYRSHFDPDLCELGPELHWEWMKSKSESWISITSPSHATTSFVISVSFKNRIKSSSNDSIYLKVRVNKCENEPIWVQKYNYVKQSFKTKLSMV